MRFAGRTHPGRRGGQNEDSIGWDEASRLWFVADGMGGHASGDVASRIVKETLLANAATTSLEDGVRKSHAAVAAEAASNPAHANMGSTVVALQLGKGQAEVVWVGDSRAYLWRNGALSALTRDHSFLEILREQENLSEAQLRGHPNKNLVTQTLGIGAPSPSVATVPLRRRDWLLLCSDGLNDELEDAEIAEILRTRSAPEDAAQALIDGALARGGRDNVSAVVVEYDGPDGVSSIRAGGSAVLQWWPIAAGVLAALAFAVAWVWFQRR